MICDFLDFFISSAGGGGGAAFLLAAGIGSSVFAIFDMAIELVCCRNNT
jgi:hypothetical protein